ncbi:MAG: 30S ribosomal protein S2 [Chloroflexi bacterium]|nr:30S ribosomal protein S2 [Chloroflexota bacterium]
MAIVTMKQLLEAGVHFGHRSRRWNPKMRSYIFTERNGIHIIDLQQTIQALERAYEVVRDIAAEGGTVVFVGTKRQAQDNIREQAERCGMPYVAQRWLGGTLTNFTTIRSRIEYMLDLEARQARGDWDRLPKKEATLLDRDLARLHRRLGRLRNLNQLPDALIVADVSTEDIAVNEANRLNIPVIAMVDTNCNPDPVDYVIPSNDDAIRAILLMMSTLADAVIEGQQMRGIVMAEEGEELPVEDRYAADAYAEYEDAYDGPETRAARPAVQSADEDDDDDDDLIIVDDLDEGDLDQE